MSSTRSKYAALAVLAIAIAAVAIWKWPRTKVEPAPASKAQPAPQREAYTPHVPAVVAGDQPAPAPPGLDTLERSLADYKAVSVYPPWSRPLSDETADKLHWNSTVVSDLPMDDRPGADLIYHFGADRWTVPFDEPFVSWIEVLDKGQRIAVSVNEAMLVSVTAGRVGLLTYHDDGLDGDAVAGDLRYSNRLVPAKYPQLATTAQQVHIEAIIGAKGIKRPITRDFAYAPRKVADIIGAREQLRDGNLVVTLDVQVTEKGLYTFDANVMAADGAPIVFGEKSYPLEPGKRSVELVMFGRAFVESGLDGPYVVQDIRGMRRFIDTDEQNFYFTYPKPLRTQAYKHSQFSGAEWDAPERQDTIANFERLIDETRAGMIGKDDGDGKAHPLPTVDPSADVRVPITAPTKQRP
jgi:hypothetical protein